jgi:hypothetical protein
MFVQDKKIRFDEKIHLGKMHSRCFGITEAMEILHLIW